MMRKVTADGALLNSKSKIFAYDSSSKGCDGSKVEKSRADRRIDGDFKSSSVEMQMLPFLIGKGEIQISKEKNAKVVNVFSKEDEVYIMSKKRNNPTFFSISAGSVAMQKVSRSMYDQNELRRRDAYHTAFDREEATLVFRQQEITNPQHSNRSVLKNLILSPDSVPSTPDHVSSSYITSMHTHNLANEERFEQIFVENSKGRRSNSEHKKTSDSISIIDKHSRGAVWKKLKSSILRNLIGLDKNKLEKIASKSGIEEGYIMSKKRNNPTFFSTPAGTVAKRKVSISTYGQNELHRRDAYHTTFDKEEEATQVFRQQEITSPHHSNSEVMKNSALFPASVPSPPDHACSTDATSMHTRNLANEERFEQTFVKNSKVRRSYSEKKKPSDSVSITGKHSQGAVWKKLKASALIKLIGLDKNKLEKIASKSGIEMINVDSTDINGALMERVREWIAEDMDRYFSESIDDAVDPKIRKLAIGKLQSIMKEIESSQDKKPDAVKSDETFRCNLSQQTRQNSTDINGALMERVREWIAEDMDRYFSESIDDAVDSTIRKLAIGKLQSIMKEIESSQDKKPDAVKSDQTFRCNLSQQTSQSLVASDVKQTEMHNVASFSAFDMISAGNSRLFSMPSLLATTVIQPCTSSETPSSTADTLQLSNKAENEGGKVKINEQQKMVCELCVIVDDSTSTEAEEQCTNSTKLLPDKLKENNSTVAECSQCAKKGGKSHSRGGDIGYSVAECSKYAKKGGACLSHGGGTHCSIADRSKSALKGGKRKFHGGGSRCSMAECSKCVAKGGLKCVSHGGGYLCSVAGCSKYAKKKGKCISHGGGTRCSVAECSKSALKGGKCVSHGGGKRCSEESVQGMQKKEGNAMHMVVVHVAM
eukprot:CAMPEP_0194298914 /NCGR_PEP_ID=MMETSP0169-20130528/60432_1 /TAXON_ID=218684 /ORGANISM="Corethron pennatum, Strain L29A3" /LENGTH=878 /DNA_ID=CAMNT_0039048961 /DNA_START=235 /DNA_END=2872 /DNA_ORIENTATION=-